MGVTGTVAIAAMGGMYSVNYYTEQKEARAAAAEIKRREGIVDNCNEVSYGNKALGNVDLSGMTVEEITAILKAESKVYKDRKVKITVDGKKYKFSMKELGENIFYKASDGTKFQAGEEEEIAEIIVNMNKDRDMQEQYDIITGKENPSVYSIKIKCQYNKKKLDKFIKKLDKNHVKTVVDARITKGGTITAPEEGRSLKLDKIGRASCRERV